nr:immunoglobulin heavy chain junction region [Mus musculus]
CAREKFYGPYAMDYW